MENTSHQYRRLPKTWDQTELDDEMKLSWYGDTKSRKHFVNETIKPRVEQRDSKYPAYGMMGVSIRAFDRQKSNVVFKTVEEAFEVYRLLYAYFDHEDYEWADRRTSDAFMRRRREIRTGLEARGYTFQLPVGEWVEILISPDGDRIDLTGSNLQLHIKK